MSKKLLILIYFFMAPAMLFSQRMPVDEYSTAPLLSQIGSAFNRVFNDTGLDSVYHKLGQVKKTGKGVVRIVHIGDSHVQAGFFPGMIRQKFQGFFGDAGRGLIFPFEAIRTTSPADISSSTNVGWGIDKIAGDADDAGISGYGIRSSSTGASLELKLPGTSFSKLRFFVGNDNNDAWIFRTGDGSESRMIRVTSPAVYTDITLEKDAGDLILSTMPSDDDHRFYGISVENGQAGVIYHSIGVNGARYDQYNKAGLFWKQLPALEADLYVISLGTNDAQRSSFDGKQFHQELNEFIKKLKKASPRAAVILTTAPDSYKNGRSNTVLRDLNMSLFEYTTAKSIPVWDLYRVTNGYGSASSWIRKGLMNSDNVHFTAEGYQLQGILFANAFAKGYNDYHGY